VSEMSRLGLDMVHAGHTHMREGEGDEHTYLRTESWPRRGRYRGKTKALHKDNMARESTA